MTRDYRKGAPPPRASGKQRRGTCFFWFVAGAMISGFGVGLAWMLDDKGQPGFAPPEQAQQPAAPQRPRGPSFDFYNILPEEEVPVPPETASRPPPPPPPKPKPKPAEEAPAQAQTKPAIPNSASNKGTGYIIQVASFRKSGDAEALKAKLALKGIQARIQTVTINGKDTYHRVRVGPFAQKGDANRARSRLKSQGYESIAIRLK